MPDNKYLEGAVPAFYRRNALDLIIHTWITSIRTVVPSVSIEECAKSCMRYYKIDEDEMSLDSVISTYHRVRRDLIDSTKTKNGKQ